jgi:predicted branched-subunit amino acid permease
MRPVAAQLTIDESTAVSTSQNDLIDQRKGFWYTGAAVFVFWNLATVFGALLGSVLSDPKVFGLDAAAAAALFALVWPRIQQSTGAIIAAVAIVSSTLLSLALPSGFPVLLGAGIAVALGFFLEREKR